MNTNTNTHKTSDIINDELEIEEPQTTQIQSTNFYPQRINLIVEESFDGLSLKNLLKYKCALAKKIKKTKL